MRINDIILVRLLPEKTLAKLYRILELRYGTQDLIVRMQDNNELFHMLSGLLRK